MTLVKYKEQIFSLFNHPIITRIIVTLVFENVIRAAVFFSEIL